MVHKSVKDIIFLQKKHRQVLWSTTLLYRLLSHYALKIYHQGLFRQSVKELYLMQQHFVSAPTLRPIPYSTLAFYCRRVRWFMRPYLTSANNTSIKTKRDDPETIINDVRELAYKTPKCVVELSIMYEYKTHAHSYTS